MEKALIGTYDSRQHQCYINDVAVTDEVMQNHWHGLLLADATLALHTLARLKWSHEAVDEYYRECDAN